MSDLGSLSSLLTDIAAKVTTNGTKANTGTRVRQCLVNIADTLKGEVTRAIDALTSDDVSNGSVWDGATVTEALDDIKIDLDEQFVKIGAPVFSGNPDFQSNEVAWNNALGITAALGGKQPVHPILTAIAGLSLSGNRVIRATGADTFDSLPVSATPSANTVVISDGSGKIDGWITEATSAAAGKVRLATDGEVNSARAVAANDSRLPRRARLASDSSNVTSTSFADTALLLSMEANAEYEVTAHLLFKTAAGTTGANISLNGPASPAVVSLFRVIRTASSQTTSTIEAYDGGAVTADVPSAGATCGCSIRGTIRNGSTAGDLVVRLATEVGGSAANLLAGSWLKLEKTN